MATSAPRTARERAREQIMKEILDTGREHLASGGGAALSLRAVARDLGMVSSAVYRYVPNRDALLTMLIVDAYDSLGLAVERAEGSVRRNDHAGRFLAACRAVRTWALAHPHEYALIYGSPVPGYAAPADTIGPASRVPMVLTTIIVELTEAGRAPAPRPVDAAVAASISPILQFTGGVLAEDMMLRGLAAWSTLFGAVSLELFGHIHNVVASGSKARAAYFEHQMRAVVASLGLAGT